LRRIGSRIEIQVFADQRQILACRQVRTLHRDVLVRFEHDATVLADDLTTDGALRLRGGILHGMAARHAHAKAGSRAVAAQGADLMAAGRLVVRVRIGAGQYIDRTLRGDQADALRAADTGADDIDIALSNGGTDP
jgi:hypothetical protein